jgi:hypothetical protein
VLSRPYDWLILSTVDDVQDTETTPLHH